MADSAGGHAEQVLYEAGLNVNAGPDPFFAGMHTVQTPRQPHPARPQPVGAATWLWRVRSCKSAAWRNVQDAATRWGLSQDVLRKVELFSLLVWLWGRAPKRSC